MNNPIFNNTKYTRWYYAIIQKRGVTEDCSGTEIHHIIPRSLGGVDEPENLVRLTYHDHAWCHWLLTKMTEGNALAKMRYAFNMMNVGGEHMGRILDSRIVRAYAKNREELIKTHSDFMKGREPWNKGKKLEGEQYKGGRKNKGRVKTQEEIEKRLHKVIGRKDTEETKEKKRIAMTGFVRGPMSDEEKLKRSIANKGKKKSKEFSNTCASRMREEFINNNPNKNPELKKTCPHCSGLFGPSNYSRWHGNNCKKK
jgi:hypothetical protein